MLDDIQESQGPDKPTWEDIELTLKFNIGRYCENCNHAVRHKICFVSTTANIQGIFAQAGNEILGRVITSIIAELIAIDPTDIAFKQFIKRLKLKLKNYELVSTS